MMMTHNKIQKNFLLLASLQIPEHVLLLLRNHGLAGLSAMRLKRTLNMLVLKKLRKAK